MQVRTSYNGSRYITAGKIYEAYDVESFLTGKTFFCIFNDYGEECICVNKADGHIDGNDWEIVETL